MKKIAIITMLGNNYGACLQAYALQRFLEINGFFVEQIDFYPENSTSNKKKISKVLSIGITGFLDTILTRKYNKIRSIKFNYFRKEYLRINEYKYHKEDITLSNDKYSIFICGSDMIWSEEFLKDWYFYYLGFVCDNKRIAYAPSFGSGLISKNNMDLCENYLKKFDYLSCREQSGCEFISKNFDLKAINACDPTLLLPSSEWDHLIESNSYSNINKEFVLAYLFGRENKKRKQLYKRIKRKYDLSFIPFAREQFKDNQNNLSVSSFLYLFKNANFIITNTFHGLVFSLIFKKPFVVLKREEDRWGKYSDRITSLLKKLDLEYRYLFPEEVDINLLMDIDYLKINKILDKFRQESICYLLSAVGDED